MTEREERCARWGLVFFTICLAGVTRHASAQATFVGATPSQLQAAAVFEPHPGLPLVAADSQSFRAELVQARAGRRDGEILMIVGGAAILTGLLADESLITIVGAGVAGYGLYLYLRATRKNPT